MTYVATQLPELASLDPARQHRSERLRRQICAAIDVAGGVIPFSQFMDSALFEPGLGFYASDTPPIGPAGGFWTAPEMGPLFARCLASPCRQVLETLAGGDIMEVGAGTGALARDLMLALDAQHTDQREALPGEYRILERSETLRTVQQRTLAELPAHLRDRFRWIDVALPMRGVVIANEVIDALAVDRFEVVDGAPRPLGVAHDGADFRWQLLDGDDAAEAKWFASIQPELFGPLPDGYRSERCRTLNQALEAFCGPLERGVALFVDYGYLRSNYYHPQRTDGTLMCHFEHQAHADPFALVGLQDLTASVDFTALAAHARAQAMTVAGYSSQTWFLLGCGLEKILSDVAAGSPLPLGAVQAAKRLLMPNEMGERVHALALAREFTRPLDAFALRDLRQRLEPTTG
ncbi:MAG: SAM-dependent methyltransferase [Chromatiales bacterium]|jgi:SAM-dependent MidA family methyltransferase|nr:SAM-dependent methyltransferase [Chromatiales bacterium]